MWLKSIEAQAEHFFPEHKFIAESIQKKAQDHISTTAGGVAKGLQRQPFFKRLVKEIY